MSFMLGHDGWVEVGEAVLFAGAGEVLSCGAHVAEELADAVLRLSLWLD